MGVCLPVFGKGAGSRIFVSAFLLCLLSVLSFAPASAAEYSNGPRQTGEEVLEEILAGPKKFLVRVASNGCTDKSSFRIDVQKEPGLSKKTPHYLLTIVRIKPDECKAIVEGGTLILFDLEKDLGLDGDFTYAVTNPVLSPSRNQPSDDSLFSIVEKYFTFDFPEIKEVKPEPFTEYAMDHNYFACYLPADWKLARDKEGDEEAGIFEVRLTMPEKAKPEDGAEYLLPDPLIYVGYYSKNNNQNKTYESFIQDYVELAQKRAESAQSRYEQPRKIEFNGAEATELTYEVYREEQRGPLVAIKYWLKAKFIVIKAKEGFYVLAYKSPREFYDRYLPAFTEVAGTFKTSD